METRKIRKFKFFMVWQDDREEAWLSEMARSGLHLKSYNGFGVYTFEPGEPRNDIYRLDYLTVQGEERQHYLQLFKDAGWEHIQAVGGWQYFRKSPGVDGPNEIFTDNASKILKYSRLRPVLIIIGVITLANVSRIIKVEGLFFQIAGFISFAISILFLVTLIKVWLRIEQLKRL